MAAKSEVVAAESQVVVQSQNVERRKDVALCRLTREMGIPMTLGRPDSARRCLCCNCCLRVESNDSILILCARLEILHVRLLSSAFIVVFEDVHVNSRMCI